MDETKKINWQLVTNIVLGLTVIALCGFIAFDTFRDRQQIQVTKSQEIAGEENPAEEIPPETPAQDLVAEYMNSNFKTVTVIDNPHYLKNESLTGKSHALYVVTERGTNDYTCGGAYVSPTCYFFLEANYYQTPDRTYIGQWKNDFASLNPDEIVFIDVNTIEFTASGGDAGYLLQEVWRLDLQTGSTTLISSTSTRSN